MISGPRLQLPGEVAGHEEERGLEHEADNCAMFMCATLGWGSKQAAPSNPIDPAQWLVMGQAAIQRVLYSQPKALLLLFHSSAKRP